MEQKEHNFVADQQNWEQRVKAELESAKEWEGNWASLYQEAEKPLSTEEKIKKVEEEIAKLPGQSLQTNSTMSFNGGSPFNENARRDFGRKRQDL
mmetsp:Transcript_26099/g.34271  ORF Transcript_26099/g.34271 Transcript_26099/m.34271 type:complete len:95 (+) Transcript_26099:170-454(+)|eukprot:CAMPEP_0117745140 /NCGR_PEP_ID=MMETSP0947-20121206/7177_1 /TAXON_ID=44440 /ORGANISM="Chattonella subsalsa, Strain CCMP2191" /LENGTH=94 /DNA_ID=CAMNT_0005562223 /DNA_START=166 /DNA_END=450 /DNA_ORIENTATION=-